jgi:hypothetical protein
VVRGRYEVTVPETVAGPNEAISARTLQYRSTKYNKIELRREFSLN